jgi:hypothetical protein
VLLLQVNGFQVLSQGLEELQELSLVQLLELSAILLAFSFALASNGRKSFRFS